MSDPNPFASPQSTPGQGVGPTVSGGFSPRTITILSQTRGWTMFCAVLWYIGAVLTLLGIVGLTAAGNALEELQQLGLFGQFAVVALVIVFFYLLVEAILLTSFAGKIGAFVRSGNPAAVRDGVRSLRVYWIFEAVAAVVFVLLSVIDVVIGLTQPAGFF